MTRPASSACFTALPRDAPIDAAAVASTSTYQGDGAASGSVRLRNMCQHQLEPDARHQFEGGDHAAGRLLAAREKLDRRRGDRHGDKGRGAACRLRKQLQHRRGDDAERAFGADEELLQIVAGVVLAQAAHQVEHAAVGQHDFEPQHQLARHAVAQHMHAAGIGRDIAADGAASLPTRGSRGKSGPARRPLLCARRA